ncbi:MAG: hypothetical protein WAK83_18595, partial [Trebonia sp.]|uniref:hypothetical protein n=1 Tax=Trebonia sp. TaxID=2767075 RepID=UPI003BB015C1
TIAFVALVTPPSQLPHSVTGSLQSFAVAAWEKLPANSACPAALERGRAQLQASERQSVVRPPF